ncbi:murein biosynthesis integral membrane protein Mu rJ [Desulfonema ishimotonii]|uniref:Probable lipid II flippase MurJ n=1 Tax=Desulfonema ishimotonii TaxID=45657 RepID=A0A401FZS7_9BACT|nr:murein biosynthesis integral membrane protein MurJ [Desulfonema ishimotonii]GBC62475.1 murein biosynthesis integral membrane protein Mu rJ [Desulfonema ishimotonii]
MSVYKKVGLASLIMMASVLLSRVIGLLREMVIAFIGGAGGEVDAYQVAFVIPEILNHILASGFLSVTFIPIFSRYLAEDREAEGWRVFSLILTGFGTVLLLFILLASVFTPLLIDLIAPGLEDPATRAAAVRMTRIIMPAQFFFFTGGLLMAVQFAKEQFAIPALAPLLYNLGIIAGGLVLGPALGMEGFSWGVLAGAFAGNFVVQLWGAKKAGMKFYLLFDFRHPDLKKYVLLSLPLMLGLTMTFSTEFFLKFFGSYLPTGSIASLNYGMRIMFILVGFFGQAVGVASFPYMARMVAENRLAEMNDLLNTTLRYLSLVMPFSALIMVLRHEVVLILFQRGRFDEAATALTARVLLWLMTGTIAFAAQTVVVRGYYAMQDTLFPAIFGTAGVILSIPLYGYGMQKMGVNGVALAISVSAILQVMMLYILWNRRTRNSGSRAVYRFMAKIALISAGIGILLAYTRQALLLSLPGLPALTGSLVICLLVGIIFLMLLLAAGYFLRIKELSEMADKIKGRLRRKKQT